MKSTLIMLTFNELPGLKELYSKIPFDVVDEVLAVDGGSTDGTIEFYKEKNIPFVIQKKKGRGSAILESAKHARGDFLVLFSPDGNEDPRDIPKLIEKIGEGYDLVISSRFMSCGRSDDSDDPLLIRRFGNNFFTFLANVFFRAGVTDAINGLRVIRKESLIRLHQDATGHEIEFQMTIHCAKLGLKIAEIPTIELERIGGIRKANTFVMGVRFTLFFIKELLIGKNF